jgi:hypothetical protein
MFQANQATAVLKSAIDLGVFAALAEAPRHAGAVAAKIDCLPLDPVPPLPSPTIANDADEDRTFVLKATLFSSA